MIIDKSKHIQDNVNRAKLWVYIWPPAMTPGVPWAPQGVPLDPEGITWIPNDTFPRTSLLDVQIKSSLYLNFKGLSGINTFILSLIKTYFDVLMLRGISENFWSCTKNHDIKLFLPSYHSMVLNMRNCASSIDFLAYVQFILTLQSDLTFHLFLFIIQVKYICAASISFLT